jgi:chorismate mutase
MQPNPLAKMKIVPVNQWLIQAEGPLIISGPCSAESREQVLETAKRLKETGIVSAFRSGIWKPRTRPNEFEGHGIPALKWLTEVKEKFNLPVAVEVATPRHVEACLKENIDILWIGARTSVNPFSVQELAEALKGVDIPVLIKNPLNPDLKLWIGVLERFMLTGINKIAAIHRGFNTWEKTRYRNEPLWEIPVKLKSLFPDLPVLTDPSHIAGNRELIREVVQHALLLDTAGFMIESHYSPDDALTDARQQITPAELALLFQDMDIPRASVQNPCRDLEIFRCKIDEIDSTLINLLSKRMEVVRDIAKIKKECHMTVLQLKRWNNIIQTRTAEGEDKGLSREFLRNLLDIIHKESIEIQSKEIS